MKLCPSTNQPSQDKVYTPDHLALQIVRHFLPTGRLLEPCAGGGAFLRAFDQCDNISDITWCEIEEGVDFLQHQGGPYDWLITNPPWSKIRVFLAHAIKLKIKNIVLLVNINALMTKARLRQIYTEGYSICEFYCLPTPCFPWPGSGFQLAAVHIQQGQHLPIKVVFATENYV